VGSSGPFIHSKGQNINDILSLRSNLAMQLFSVSELANISKAAEVAHVRNPEAASGMT